MQAAETNGLTAERIKGFAGRRVGGLQSPGLEQPGHTWISAAGTVGFCRGVLGAGHISRRESLRGFSE